MGVVSGPSLEILKNLYFVRLGPGEILAVMVGAGGLMRNKVLTGQENLSQDELNQVNRYLAEEAPGLTLDGIRLKIITAMGDEKRAFDRLYERAFRLAQASAGTEAGQADRGLFMEGRGNLLEYPEFSETEAMKALFTAFEDKRRLINLLNEVAQAGQVRIVLGSEAAAAALSGLALVASPYTRGDRTLGALGIIGPQRLDYSEIVPVVDYAARVVSGILENS
jgi:heat-inducible transcriptional repressor